jgi:hypothetical protein
MKGAEMTLTFYMTVTGTDGTVAKGACSDAEVMRSLATAARRGYEVEVTQQGGANITREIPGRGRHTVVYEPFRSAGNLTATSVRDLCLIGIRPTAELQPETGRIKAGYVNSIPPAASDWLRFRGLVAVDGTTVTVSMSARLAMLALGHRPYPWAYILTAAELAEFTKVKGGSR